MRRITKIVIVLVLVFGAIVFIGSNFYLDWLWFANFQLAGVFWITFFSRWGVQLAAWIIFFIFLWLNFIPLKRSLLNPLRVDINDKFDQAGISRYLDPRILKWFTLLAAVFLSILFGSGVAPSWMQIRQFFVAPVFNITDPIFNLDVGYFVFRLPVYELLVNYLLLMFIVTFIVSALIYYLTSPPVQVGRFNFIPERGQRHLSLLLALTFLVIAWRYRLKMYELVYSPRGIITGAGYADIHAQLPALWILLAVSVLIAVMFAANIFLRKNRLMIYGIGGLAVVSLLVGMLYPGIIQQFVVEPNEFAYEEEYIQYNIDYTQNGFGLSDIVRREFPAEQTLTWDDLTAAEGTVENIRLWDYRPIQTTFQQLQGIRPYYSFANVDTDRYELDGGVNQLMLSARELDPELLPEQSWLNRRLQYTHGYGVAASPVSEVRSDNLPVLIAKNLPQAAERGLKLENPRIYYGEVADDYVIVNTKAEEFDYSVGESNAYFTYDGTGGVPVGNFLRRILFAIKLGDYQMLFSGDITSESRVMFDREIQNRIRKVAPFLLYDDDPYIVIDQGRLFWIQDAYTVSSRFPYSEYYQGVNYIRNSVKVVIDAYNGDMHYYIADQNDPIAESYSLIFPDLFKPLNEMPAGLQEHVRYPEDLFALQAQVYLTYHMENTRVFYNNEDEWQIPNEKFYGEQQPIEAYYTMIQIPGETSEEFVMMIPFTPRNKQNMVAWMAARSDLENYGGLEIFNFPRGSLVSGPAQVEAYIDQDTLISQQLSLWDQRGSSVIRGNLLVLPIADSIIYIEPIYLQSANEGLPELARVIVYYKDNVVMEPTVEAALGVVFGERDSGEDDPGVPQLPVDETLEELAARAQELYTQAQARLSAGDWSGYGEAMEELEQVLTDMSEFSSGSDLSQQTDETDIGDTEDTLDEEGAGV